jgi:uncharacterized protein (TIGR03083 family)
MPKTDLDRRGAFRAERAQVLALCESLKPADWRTSSQAEGWSVQDVVAHMGAGVHAMFGPAATKLLLGKDIEKLNDEMVEIRRSRSAGEVLSEYRRWTGVFANVMPPLAATPLGGTPLPLSELGKFPLRLFISALVFDTYTHLRHDIAPALGRQVPAADANRIAVSFEWMMAVLSNQLRTAPPVWLDRPISISLTGPGGGLWLVEPSGAVVPGASASAAAIIRGVAAEFPEWGTRRAKWRDCDVAITGDAEYGTAFLDQMNIV